MKWNDFLNPRSMLTPGIAGSVVMVIANTLWVEFMVPQKWTALILSFLLIIPILMKYSASLIENIIYFTFNGLIVFALAVNTNFAGKKLSEVASSRSEPIAQAFSQTLTASLGSSDKPIQNIQDEVKLAATNTQGLTIKTETKTKVIDKEAKKKLNAEKPAEEKKKREFFGTWFDKD